MFTNKIPENYAFYSLNAGCQYLKLGDNLPWKDKFSNPSEKYFHAYSFIEKAAKLNPECRSFEVILTELMKDYEV